MRDLPARSLLLSRRLLNRFFAAGSKKTAQGSLLRQPRLMIQIILGGTFLFTTVLLILLAVSVFGLGNYYVVSRLIWCALAFIYLGIIVMAVQRQAYKVAAWLLIVFYAHLAFAIALLWGINVPVGVLTFGFVIILAAVLLGASYILPVTFGVIALLSFVQVANTLGVVTSDTSSLALPSNFGDVVSYGIIFLIIALVSWLSRRQIEQALKQALKAEAAVAREKKLLAVRLEQRTRELRETQLQEMRHLYRFAELGQISTVVLHELSNYLTVLTLDIDDIQQRHHQSQAVVRAKESIGYLDAMVRQVKRQLRTSHTSKEFSVLDVLIDTVDGLQSKAIKAGVKLELQPPVRRRSTKVMGDPLRLSQIVIIIVSNAIESYAAKRSRADVSRVVVDVEVMDDVVRIGVCDWGVGISVAKRQQLFEPFSSGKKGGLGIGLFVTRQMIQTHFNGRVWLDDQTDCTKFVIELPRYQRSKK